MRSTTIADPGLSGVSQENLDGQAGDLCPSLLSGSGPPLRPLMESEVCFPLGASGQHVLNIGL